MSAPPPPAVFEGDGVDALLAELNRLADARSRTALLLPHVGLAILDAWFGGSGERYRTCSADSALLRRLLRDPRLPISPSKVGLAVRLGEQLRELGAIGRRLSGAHQLALLAAPESRRGELADRCARQAWTARELEVAIGGHDRSARTGRGRPARSAASRMVRDVVKRTNDPLLVEALRTCELSERTTLVSELAAAASVLLALADSITAAANPPEYPTRK